MKYKSVSEYERIYELEEEFRSAAEAVRDAWNATYAASSAKTARSAVKKCAKEGKLAAEKLSEYMTAAEKKSFDSSVKVADEAKKTCEYLLSAERIAEKFDVHADLYSPVAKSVCPTLAENGYIEEAVGIAFLDPRPEALKPLYIVLNKSDAVDVLAGLSDFLFAAYPEKRTALLKKFVSGDNPDKIMSAICGVVEKFMSGSVSVRTGGRGAAIIEGTALTAERLSGKEIGTLFSRKLPMGDGDLSSDTVGRILRFLSVLETNCSIDEYIRAAFIRYVARSECFELVRRASKSLKRPGVADFMYEYALTRAEKGPLSRREEASFPDAAVYLLFAAGSASEEEALARIDPPADFFARAETIAPLCARIDPVKTLILWNAACGDVPPSHDVEHVENLLLETIYSRLCSGDEKTTVSVREALEKRPSSRRRMAELYAAAVVAEELAKNEAVSEPFV